MSVLNVNCLVWLVLLGRLVVTLSDLVDCKEFWQSYHWHIFRGLLIGMSLQFIASIMAWYWNSYPSRLLGKL